MKEKKTVFCSECRTNVGVHGNKTMNHNYGTLRCVGSRHPLIAGFPAKVITKKVFEKMQNGTSYLGFIIGETFYILSPLIKLSIGDEVKLQETESGWQCKQPAFTLAKSYSFNI